jgi:hypothetical protein
MKTLFTYSKRTILSQSKLGCELHNQTDGEGRRLTRDKPKPEKPALGHPSASDVREVAANTLTFGLSLAEKIAECAPVPGLKGAIGALNLTLSRFEVRSTHNLTM